MAQFQVLADTLAAQVKIAVFHTQVITAVGIVLDGKGRRIGRIDDIKTVNQNLYITCGNLGVLA